MGSVCRQIVIVGLAFLVSPGLVFAQASISGRALDEQQGLIPGATVTVRQLETNATRTILTNDTGRYHFPNLPVGTYELTVELSGFSKLVRTGVRLALNQDAVMDVTLQPATLAEQITVRADSPILNTTSPEVGVRWDTTRVAELPVGNRTCMFCPPDRRVFLTNPISRLPIPSARSVLRPTLPTRCTPATSGLNSAALPAWTSSSTDILWISRSVLMFGRMALPTRLPASTFATSTPFSAVNGAPL